MKIESNSAIQKTFTMLAATLMKRCRQQSAIVRPIQFVYTVLTTPLQHSPCLVYVQKAPLCRSRKRQSYNELK